jgi:hypothetical protein
LNYIKALKPAKLLTQFFAVFAIGAALLLSHSVALAAKPTKEGIDFFEKNIRPVLAASCYKCHSTAAKGKQKLEANLYLDSWTGIARGGQSGKPAVVPGELDNSPLIKAIRYKYSGDDDYLNMPPKSNEGGGKLSDAAIKCFETWVAMGAPYPQDAAGVAAAAEKPHWAFQTPKWPALPRVNNAQDAAHVRNPIDVFVIATLEKNGLMLNRPADKRTLLRRATFDLTGLPPTPAEVDDFLRDNSPEAFGKVVDRLLASPRYGERWGRHWLDVARYSDTKGYVFEEERRYPYAYTYRDWVINAFNNDLPFDQFLVDQIAADKLDTHGDNRSLAALGFLTLGRRFLNSAPEIVDDRLDVICRGTMGLTIGCARCHDHKFDPIPASDYYSLYGVLDSSMEPKELPLLNTAVSSSASLAFEKELKTRQGAVDAYRNEQAKLILDAVRAPAVIADYLLSAQNTAIHGGEGKDEPNRFLLHRYRAMLKAAGPRHAVFGPWHAYAALPEAKFAALSPEITRKLFGTGSNRKSDFNALIAAAFIDKPPASLREVAQRYGTALSRAAGSNKREKADEEDLRLALYGEQGPLAVAADDYHQLFKRDVLNKLTKMQKEVDGWIASRPDAPPRAMVLVDAPGPHDVHVHLRGNAGNQGPLAPRHFLTVLSHGAPQPLTEGSGRLQLARAVASRDNPLTARVWVNRVWLHHFGKGIVRTPSDFGTRSDSPTHPELLDWLALRFMDDGWSVKKLHRLIMLSATYQQSSDDNAAAMNVDPENLLLWRMNRQRLDFEATRDSLLAVVGELDETRGGPPKELSDPANRRRTIYGTIDRQNLPSLFRAFDFASPDATSPQRFTTTTPQQALYFMNSDFVMRRAKALASRPDIKSAAVQARIAQLYRTLYAREATPQEVSAGEKYLEAEAAFAANKKASQVSPWEKYAQVLLESNEFVFVD